MLEVRAITKTYGFAERMTQCSLQECWIRYFGDLDLAQVEGLTVDCRSSITFGW